jgi:hypothetical protein
MFTDEDTCIYPYKDYISLNKWQVNWDLLSKTYYSITMHLRLGKKVSYTTDCGETLEAHPSKCRGKGRGRGGLGCTFVDNVDDFDTDMALLLQPMDRSPAYHAGPLTPFQLPPPTLAP